jgi:hypothetical protein
MAAAGLARAHEFAATLEDEAEVLLLQTHAGSHVVLTWIGREEELALWFHASRDADTLGALLDAIGVSRVHLDAVEPPPRPLQDLPSRLKRRRDDPVLSLSPLPHLRSTHLHAPATDGAIERPRRLTAPLRALARMLGRRG